MQVLKALMPPSGSKGLDQQQTFQTLALKGRTNQSENFLKSLTWHYLFRESISMVPQLFVKKHLSGGIFCQ